MNMSSESINRINIAIDGPAGAGKSTVARKVAAQLRYVYVDTGAMYRAVTFLAQQNKVAVSQSDELASLVSELDLILLPETTGQRILLNGQDITENIRSREVTSSVSDYAMNEHVRAKLGQMQKDLARNKGIVMDGRDIGSSVLPDAELKVFLTATVQERALRRYRELTESNYVPLAQLEKEIAARDLQDETRDISPLKKASDALLLDSSDLTIDEVVTEIVTLAKEKLMEVI